MERPKKKVFMCKKAIIHFSLCFVMGFFTGFAPMGKPSFLSSPSMANNIQQTHLQLAPKPIEDQQNSLNRSLAETMNPPISSSEERLDDDEDDETVYARPRNQVIVITPTNGGDRLREVLLRRMSNTLKLVKPPLLWIVVESVSETSNVSHVLRKTGVMYRHLEFKENFTKVEDDMDHQRNLALNHIEHHRLSGIVHFSTLSNVYDLSFFDEIRAIEAFGTWPLAKLTGGRKNVRIEGPICRSSRVVGWHLKKMNDQTEEELQIPISNFAFNSSILWDPERWGRLSPTQGTKQDLLKFVKQAVVEDESFMKGVPQEDCSKLNLWQLHLSTRANRKAHYRKYQATSMGKQQPIQSN
ncbi:hypothetical protein V2J09_010538 [Rumex salicifolius]